MRLAFNYTATAKPPLDLVQQWVNEPRSDKRIQRNPAGLDQIDRIAPLLKLLVCKMI
jgi:hypothetical protein